MLIIYLYASTHAQCQLYMYCISFMQRCKNSTIYNFAILNRLLPKIVALLIPPQPNTDNSSIYHPLKDYSHTCHYWVMKLAPVPCRPLRVSQCTGTAGFKEELISNTSQDFCLITASWLLLEFHIIILLFSNRRVC